MASRYEVEVTITSAKGLKNVNWRHGPNKPYAVVWVDPSRKCSTKVDEEGDTDPYWDHTLTVPLPRPVDDDTKLYIDIVHYGQEEDTKPLIGSAKLKLKEIIDDVGYGESTRRSLTLKRPSGRPQGKLDVKVAVKDKEARSRDAYYPSPYGVPQPPQPYGSEYGAPPPTQNPYYSSAAPPSGYPYGAPPPQPYGQPPEPYGQPPQPYGQPPQPYGQSSYGYGAPPNPSGLYQGEEKKKSKFGGMGTGLAVGAVAGAIGGIALMEGVDALEDKIADDVAEKVEDDLGYDDDGDF